MFISQRVTNVRNTHSQVQTILVFPVKAPQLLSCCRPIAYLQMLQEQVSWLTVSVYVPVLSHRLQWGQMSDGVPLALGGTETCSNKLLVWLQILCRESGTLQKIRLHAETLWSGYIAAPHSRAGAGFNDTIVSRWLRQRGESCTGIFSQELLTCFYKWTHSIDACLWFL